MTSPRDGAENPPRESGVRGFPDEARSLAGKGRQLILDHVAQTIVRLCPAHFIEEISRSFALTGLRQVLGGASAAGVAGTCKPSGPLCTLFSSVCAAPEVPSFGAFMARADDLA